MCVRVAIVMTGARQQPTCTGTSSVSGALAPHAQWGPAVNGVRVMAMVAGSGACCVPDPLYMF